MKNNTKPVNTIEFSTNSVNYFPTRKNAKLLRNRRKKTPNGLRWFKRLSNEKITFVM